MNGLLFDTNAVIWTVFQSSRLSPIQQLVLNSRPVWVSQISFIEIAIKLNNGRLALPEIFSTDFPAAVREVVADLDATVLSLEMDHIARLSRLPILHRDPFDRLIICQAYSSGLTVVTSDRAFSAYAGLDVLEI